ncbi:MAG: flagellar type III secretion system pore protein FliP [Cycloclasticus sp.]
MKITLIYIVLSFFFVPEVNAETINEIIPSFSIVDSGGELGGELAQPVKIFLLITALSLLPSLLVLMTSFTRIIIILSMLRQAIGLQNTPPNFVLISLALILTYFSMLPVIDNIDSSALKPYQSGAISDSQALEESEKIIKSFMLKNTNDDDLMMMYELAEKDVVDNVDLIPLPVLVPAFLVSELQLAFQIGFFIFLPFLLVDLVVASVLMSIGMIMVPPMTISLPIKVLLFVLVDGWSLLVYSLMSSY